MPREPTSLPEAIENVTASSSASHRPMLRNAGTASEEYHHPEQLAAPSESSSAEPAPPAGDVEAVHEGREALIGFAQAGEAAENAEIHPRIEREQEPLDPGFPLLGEGVAQGAAVWWLLGGPPDFKCSLSATRATAAVPPESGQGNEN